MTTARPTEAEWIAAHKIMEADPVLAKVVTYMIEVSNDDASTMLAAAIQALLTGRAKTSGEALKIALDAAKKNIYARQNGDVSTDTLQ